MELKILYYEILLCRESLNTDGTHRPDVWHGECPVLLGQKISMSIVDSYALII